MSLQLDARQRAMLSEMGIALPVPAVPPIQIAPEIIATRAQPERARGQFDSKTEAASASAGLAPLAAGIATMQWAELAQTAAVCRACTLCNGRRNTVFGTGDLQADWLIVGEAPGENEDLQGEPLVGQAGDLLDNMLRALGLDRRHKVYITNAVKCRPPGNRNPELEEVAQCEAFLRRQVSLLQPKIILAMGRFAVQSLLQSTEPIGKLRGRAHRYGGVPVVVTYPPSYLLRNLPDKARAWADLCLAMDLMEGAGTPASS